MVADPALGTPHLPSAFPNCTFEPAAPVQACVACGGVRAILVGEEEDVPSEGDNEVAELLPFRLRPCSLIAEEVWPTPEAKERLSAQASKIALRNGESFA
jgi:hypothetical protein